MSIRDWFECGHYNYGNTSIGVLCLLLSTSYISQVYEITEDGEGVDYSVI
jgi:hypothetical protein